LLGLSWFVPIADLGHAASETRAPRTLNSGFKAFEAGLAVAAGDQLLD
jgi:hypothetical protein